MQKRTFRLSPKGRWYIVHAANNPITISGDQDVEALIKPITDIPRSNDRGFALREASVNFQLPWAHGLWVKNWHDNEERTVVLSAPS